MSEETAAPKAAESSPSATLQVGCAILVIAMGVFIVVTLNKMKQQLEKLNSTVDAVQQVAASNNLGAFDVKDANGNIVYRFERKPSDIPEGEPAPESGAPADK